MLPEQPPSTDVNNRLFTGHHRQCGWLLVRLRMSVLSSVLLFVCLYAHVLVRLCLYDANWGLYRRNQRSDRCFDARHQRHMRFSLSVLQIQGAYIGLHCLPILYLAKHCLTVHRMTSSHSHAHTNAYKYIYIYIHTANT